MKKFLAVFLFVFLFSGTALSQEMSYWYNYSKGEMEARLSPPPQQQMIDFIPQVPAAQGLYETYLAMGKNHIEAARLVLEAVLDINQKTNN